MLSWNAQRNSCSSTKTETRYSTASCPLRNAKERNHRIFLFGGFMESIVPELKTMTEDEGKDFLYHIAKSSEAQEYLKKRAEGVEAR